MGQDAKEGVVTKLRIALAAVIAAGLGMFLKNFEIRGLDQLEVVSRGASSTKADRGRAGLTTPARTEGTIRIASFNIQVLGEQKMDQPAVVRVLAQVLRRFDVTAIQEVRSKGQDILPRLVAAVNEGGGHYDWLIGPRLGRTDSKEQYAFVYNRETIETDAEAVYTVHDPDDLLHREPLVAPFRARLSEPQRAFTFTLINVHTDPDEARSEVNVLDDVYRAVRNDGRGEDDVLLVGDFNVDEHYLGDVALIPDIGWAISGIPTNTRGTTMLDNLVFGRLATVEYTGRSGVLDLVREFNLTVEEALAVSDHLPVWAEFSAREGEAGNRMASRPWQER